MTRHYYHLMGTLDSLLRYLAGTTTGPATSPGPPLPQICDDLCRSGTYPHPFSAATPPVPNHTQAFTNLECIRRVIQAKARALSTALDNMLDAREELLRAAQTTYGGFQLADVAAALNGSRERRRTFPQLSYTDVGMALAEIEFNNLPVSGQTTDAYVAILRRKCAPGINFVNALAQSAQRNKQLMDEFKARRCDLFQALAALDTPLTSTAKNPLKELDPTLYRAVQALMKQLGPSCNTRGTAGFAAGGGGPGDGFWPDGYVSSSSSTSNSSSSGG